METQKLITILNMVCLGANLCVAIAGIFILRDARKSNREFIKWFNEKKKG